MKAPKEERATSVCKRPVNRRGRTHGEPGAARGWRQSPAVSVRILVLILKCEQVEARKSRTAARLKQAYHRRQSNRGQYFLFMVEWKRKTRFSKKNKNSKSKDGQGLLTDLSEKGRCFLRFPTGKTGYMTEPVKEKESLERGQAQREPHGFRMVGEALTPGDCLCWLAPRVHEKRRKCHLDIGPEFNQLLL